MSEDKTPNNPTSSASPPESEAAHDQAPLEPTLRVADTGSAQNTTISDFLNRLGLKGGVALEAPHDLLETKSLSPDPKGRYDIGGVVGSGGMGTVLKAKDINLHRWVAMKVARQPGRDLQVQVLRFIEEAQVTGQLDHPNIVPVYELGVDASDSVFYTMKLVTGITLQQILQELRAGNPETMARYPLARLLGIFLKACDAMAFAHSKGVIHRDLKPQNIMVGGYGEVLVLDWGLAKVLRADKCQGKTGVPPVSGSAERPSGAPPDQGDRRDACLPPQPTVIKSRRAESADDAHHTLDGQVMGTPAFMAPEQAGGRINELDARTDIYALGAILYNILALRPPVEGVSLQEVLAKVTTGQITPPTALRIQGSEVRVQGEMANPYPISKPEPRTLNPAPFFPHCPDGRIPEALSAVAMKALALKPDDRYPDVKELQADIERYQTGFATLAENAGLGRQFSLLVRRHKGLVTAAALVFLAISVGLIMSLAQWRQAVAARLVAETNEQRADRNEKQALTARDQAVAAQTEALASKAEAETRRDQAEYSSYRALLGLAQGYLDKGDEKNARRELASCPKRFRHWEWGFLSRQCRLIEESTDAGYSWTQVAMSRDGKRVAWPTSAGIVVESVGDGERRIIGPKPSHVKTIQFTADGESLVVLGSVAHSTDGTMELYHINTDKCLWQTKVPAGYDSCLAVSPIEPYVVAGGGSGPPFAPFSLVDLGTGTVFATLGQVDTPVVAAVWTPDGNYVWWSSGNDLHLYDVWAGTELKCLTGHAFRVTALTMTPDGQRLASAGANGNVRVWATSTGTLVASFWHTAGIRALLFTDGGKCLLGGGVDGTLCAWDPASGRMIGMKHGAPVVSLAGAPESELIYIGYTNATLRRMSLGEITGQAQTEHLYSLRGGGGVAFSPRGDRLLYGKVGQFILLAPDAMSASRVLNHSINKYTPQSLAWNGDETAPAATGYSNGDVCVWDLQEGKLLHEFKGDRHAWAWSVVCWIEPGKLLAAGGQTAAEVNLYDINTGELVRRLDTTTKLVVAMALSPDRKTLYIGGEKGLMAFDVATWQSVPLALSPVVASAYALAFSPDGEWLAISGYSGGILGTRLWRTGQNEMHAGIEGVAGLHRAFTADGKRLIVDSGPGAITLIDPVRGTPLLTMTDSSYGEILGLVFSPDSRRLVSTAGSLLSREADPWEE